MVSSLKQQVFRFIPSKYKRIIKSKVEAKVATNRKLAARKELIHRAAKLSNLCLDGVKDLESWNSKREIVKSNLEWALGIQGRERLSLTAELKGTSEKPNYIIERWLFQPVPGLYVTANLYLPKSQVRNHPCVIYLCGHWPSLDGAKFGFQDRYQWYPENGFALLVVDPLGFGEIPGIHHGTFRLNRFDWISKGHTPAGLEVWVGMHLIDWLCQNQQIDGNRLGLTGISGGGVMTQYLAAMDERIKVVAASCSTFTIENQISDEVINGNCDCTFYPNLSGIDFPEVLALIAPRPFMILGGRKDPVFPPKGFRDAYSKTKNIYQLYQDGHRLINLVESNEGHTDPPHFLHETRKWLANGLGVQLNDDAWKTEAIQKPFEAGFIRVLHQNPVTAINYHSDIFWQPLPNIPEVTTQESWAARKNEVLEKLHNIVFKYSLSQAPVKREKVMIGSGGFVGEMVHYQEYELYKDSEVPFLLRLLKPKEECNLQKLVIWVKDIADEVMFPDMDEYFPLLKSHIIAVVAPRFSDSALTPSERSQLERSAALLGTSIAALQISDVLDSLQWLKQKVSPNKISIVGRKDCALLAMYASLLSQDIDQTILVEPPSSHTDAPAIPCILRFTDTEELVTFIAPKETVLISFNEDLYSKAGKKMEHLGLNRYWKTANSIVEAILSK